MELLVVIAIIAILVGLTVPAIQRARAAAARTECANHLRQIGLATHQYHDSARRFPSGMYLAGGKSPYRLSSWLTHLLPYIEQAGLWEQTQEAYRITKRPFQNPPHVGLATVIPIFTCPADSRLDTAQFAPRDKFYVAFTSYLGVSGLDLTTNDGILYRDSQVRLADVTDGASNTLLAGERPPSTDFQYGWWYAGIGQRHTGSCDMILGVCEQNKLVVRKGSCPPGTYSFTDGNLNNQCDMFHFWSLHAGGGHFLFADGSVHFLAYSAAPMLPALASRAGGESVQVPD
jgi:prepilin-type processing-associated H-X9-DG protein